MELEGERRGRIDYYIFIYDNGLSISSLAPLPFTMNRFGHSISFTNNFLKNFSYSNQWSMVGIW